MTLPASTHHFILSHQRSQTPAAFFLCLLGLWLSGCAVAAPQSLPAPTPPATPAGAPTLDDFWEGLATFELEIADTGLPMGESDTVILANGTWRTYVHASHQSLGVRDQCGAPVEFPGCLVTGRGNCFPPIRFCSTCLGMLGWAMQM